MAKSKPVTIEPDDALPTQIQLTCPFAFYDESQDGAPLRQWAAGAVITDPAEIKLLNDMGAEHVDITPDP